MNSNLYLSATPPNTFERNGRHYEIKPNADAFNNKQGLYRFREDENRLPYLLIDSRRDTLLHITVWRILAQDGTSYETDSKNLIPYTYEEAV